MADPCAHNDQPVKNSNSLRCPILLEHRMESFNEKNYFLV